MSLYDYRASIRLAIGDPPFHALVMAAMRKADSENITRLQGAFPETWLELNQRYNAPGGCITPGELAALKEEIEQGELDREAEEDEAEARDELR